MSGQPSQERAARVPGKYPIGHVVDGFVHDDAYSRTLARPVELYDSHARSPSGREDSTGQPRRAVSSR